jgi:hypothetical protein
MSKVIRLNISDIKRRRLEIIRRRHKTKLVENKIVITGLLMVLLCYILLLIGWAFI